MKCKSLIGLAFAGYLALAATSARAGDVMYVEHGKIYTADGVELVIRGINQNHLWGNQDQNTDAVQDVSKTPANTVRAVFGPYIGVPLADKEAIVREYILEQDVNVIVDDHGATGQTDTQSLEDCVARWLDPATVAWLTDPVLQKRLILNIANEWSGTDNYIPAYMDAIAQLRAAGIKVPLMIDANGQGQNILSIFASWKQLLASDPLHNVIFDIHMYDQWSTSFLAGHFNVELAMDLALAFKIPLVVGEFTFNDGSNQFPYDTRQLMKTLNDRSIGWLGWSWTGNGDGSSLNMIAGSGWRLSDGLSPWGILVITDPTYGLGAPSGGGFW